MSSTGSNSPVMVKIQCTPTKDFIEYSMFVLQYHYKTYIRLSSNLVEDVPERMGGVREMHSLTVGASSDDADVLLVPSCHRAQLPRVASSQQNTVNLILARHAHPFLKAT